MQLKKLTIQGFKSFGDRLEFTFGPGITAIVGPNGSGKSNVVDAIRWAVGEQSMRALRGERLEDIIFNGSGFRRPHGLAEVSLLFTNEDHVLPVDYGEITVTRRAYRSGNSEFYLNGVPCRLRDIQDLFADTGIGKDGYAFIGQGKVDEVLNMNPKQRRMFLEQAAGAWKWRRRKTEAEDKMDQTERDLVRLQDVCAELERQREPLAKEAELAIRYQNRKNRLKELQIHVGLNEIRSLEKKIALVQNKFDCGQHKMEEIARDRAAVEEKLKSERSKISAYNVELEQLKAKQDQIQHNFALNEKELITLLGRARERAVRIEATQNQGLELADRHIKLEGLLDQSEKELTQLVDTLLKEKEALALFQNRLHDLEHKYKQAQTRVQKQQERKAGYLNEQLSHSNTLKSMDREQQLLTERKTRAAATAKEARSRIEDIRLCHQREAENLALLTGQEQQLKLKQAELEQQVESLFKKQQAQERECNYCGRILTSMEARLCSLQSLEGNYGSYYQGPRSVLSANRPGIIGAVAQLLRVPSEHEQALVAALGPAQQYLIATSDKEAAAAINWLRATSGGRATFLPLNSIRQQIRTRAEQQLEKLTGAVGWADELVDFPTSVAPAIKYLLARVLVVHDLDAARAIAKDSGFKFKLVTLAGDVLNPGGSLVGGSINKSQSSQLSLSRQLRELKATVADKKLYLAQEKEKLEAIKDSKKMLETKLGELQQNLNKIRQKLAARQDIVRTYMAQMAEAEHNLVVWMEEERLLATKLLELATEQGELLKLEQTASENLAQWETMVAKEEQAQQELRIQLEDLGEKALTLRLEVAALQEQEKQLKLRNQEYRQSMAELQQQQTMVKKKLGEMERLTGQERGKQQQLEQIQTRIESELVQIQINIDRKTSQLSELGNGLQEDDAKLVHLLDTEKKQQQQVHQLELNLGRLQADWLGAQKRLFETYAVPRDCSVPAVDLKPAEAQMEIDRLKKEIEAMDVVNLRAPQSLDELNRRYSFLHRQAQDVEFAKDALLKLIEDIDRMVAIQLQRTFEQIREHFRQVFPCLFQGGEGDLRLTTTDPNEAGLEILAQLPGKKMQPLVALSGGERALTAIGFLFALLKCGRSPVCVLDEIDAPLDQANAERFLSYLEKLAAETQFITVTHKRQAMVRARALYGLALAPNGTSSVVSVKLSEAAS